MMDDQEITFWGIPIVYKPDLGGDDENTIYIRPVRSDDNPADIIILGNIGSR